MPNILMGGGNGGREGERATVKYLISLSELFDFLTREQQPQLDGTHANCAKNTFPKTHIYLQ